MIKTKSAVLFGKKKIKLIDINLNLPVDKEILVKNLYSSICYTQVGEWLGLRGKDKYLPHCFGHEGTGIVTKIGKKVKKIKIGDYVCLSWVGKKKKKNKNFTFYSKKYGNINSGPVNTFSKFSLVDENKVYKIKKKNLKTTCLMGCAAYTAFRSIDENKIPNKNHKIVILGMGGIGLSLLIILNYLKIKNIFCIDINKKKKKLSLDLGAKNFFLYNEALKKNLVGNSDYIFDSTGKIDVIKNFFKYSKPYGGKYIFLGNPKFNQNLKVNSWDLMLGRSISGCWKIQSDMSKAFTKYYRHFVKIRKFNKIFSNQKYNLQSINKAFNDFAFKKTLKPLIKI